MYVCLYVYLDCRQPVRVTLTHVHSLMDTFGCVGSESSRVLLRANSPNARLVCLTSEHVSAHTHTHMHRKSYVRLCVHFASASPTAAADEGVAHTDATTHDSSEQHCACSVPAPLCECGPPFSLVASFQTIQMQCTHTRTLSRSLSVGWLTTSCCCSCRNRAPVR